MDLIIIIFLILFLFAVFLFQLIIGVCCYVAHQKAAIEQKGQGRQVSSFYFRQSQQQLKTFLSFIYHVSFQKEAGEHCNLLIYHDISRAEESCLHSREVTRLNLNATNSIYVTNV